MFAVLSIAKLSKIIIRYSLNVQVTGVNLIVSKKFGISTDMQDPSEYLVGVSLAAGQSVALKSIGDVEEALPVTGSFVNRAGVPVALGSSGEYYCGRTLGGEGALECNPTIGPLCPDCLGLNIDNPPAPAAASAAVAAGTSIGAGGSVSLRLNQIAVGKQVTLIGGFIGGCLRANEAGEVIEVDHSSLCPYLVKALDGTLFWYKRKSLLLYTGPPPASRSSPARIPDGSRVVLADGADSDGPLHPGDIGTLYESDGSSMPYHVRTESGSTHWYRAEAIRLFAPVSTPVAAPVEKAVCIENMISQFDIGLGTIERPLNMSTFGSCDAAETVGVAGTVCRIAHIAVERQGIQSMRNKYN